jgi:predicted nucleic acid-binding protein
MERTGWQQVVHKSSPGERPVSRAPAPATGIVSVHFLSMNDPLTADRPPAVVMDTNVLFDWLVFGNPAVAPLVAAIEQGRLAWIATESLRAEMAHVLGRGLDPRWPVDEVRWRDAWDRHARLVPEPVAPLGLPRCSDADDQKFFALAVCQGARWLVTRDKALLKLARRARPLGLAILTPERWAAERDPGPSGPAGGR